MINFVFGRAYQDNSGYLNNIVRENIKKNEPQDILYLVPEQMTHIADIEILDSEGIDEMAVFITCPF